jgi:hypothetical protein
MNRFREELDREEDVRGALHPVVCDHDHDHQTAPEIWRCVIAAQTAIAALGRGADMACVVDARVVDAIDEALYFRASRRRRSTRP